MNAAHEALDLNLLVTFDLLLRERSLTRTAAALGVTQSAASHALRRLRTALNDPLFVRSGQGMLPTPRALAMADAVRAGLADLRAACALSLSFDPTTARRTFRLQAPDIFHLFALPRLLQRVRDRAPGVDLEVQEPADIARALREGALDIAVVATSRGERIPVPSVVGEGLMQRVLLDDGFSCFVDAAHPATGGLDLDTYLAHPHVLVSPTGRGEGVVDGVLDGLGRQRRIALRVPHFATAAAALRGTDLILTAPTVLARVVDEGVCALSPPIALPDLAVAMVWHERFTNDPAHAWLRDALVEVLEAF